MQNKKRQPYALNQSPLFKVSSRRRLATILKLELEELENLANGTGLYKEWDEPKPKGGTRHIENPIRPLKKLQARIATLLGRIEAPAFLFCPVKRRSYVGNAAVHRHNTMVHTLDIGNYFQSTKPNRVHWFYRHVMQCSPDVAAVLTKISTFNEHLPTGSPLSPLLSFFSHMAMWERIVEIVRATDCTITVYIDDVTISGMNIPAGLLWKVRQIIHNNGLRYHKEKHYHNKPAEITGTIVNNGSVLLPNRRHKALYDLRLKLQTASSEEKDEIKIKIKGHEGSLTQLTKAN